MDTENTPGTAQTSFVDTVLNALLPFAPLLIAIVLVLSALIALHYLLLAKQSHLTSEQKLPRQVGMLVLTIVGAVVIAISLPVSESTRNQVIALIGVLISGVIAFSSTTMVGNLMAGIVLRVNRPFKVGDFIKVEGYSGRVTEMGLLDVEIQTESRELIAFANTLMVNSPVSVTRASGAIVSVDISLGYDIHHSIIEKHLIVAAENAQLSEPFVQVVGLGDFSVSYRISGLLTEVKSLLSARSRLHKAVLDALHNADIEIVSPSFMNQRPQPDGLKMIAKSPGQTKQEEASPEDVIFDKAEEAEQKEKSKETLMQTIADIDAKLAESDGESRDEFKHQKATAEAQLATLVKSKDEEG
ncbi:mechanosensitive ion channel family protein [Alteromonas sp. ALT199]|uniref:mechanosensitive ion channel family protein n=1 Tax=unclassified Alteromonas TaxID=2614992 RepID=UPI001BE8EE71|nr:mechanosensitive ion channel family protein [Alteromonas sp. ALT199]MBT3135916.1 mechanosensitive ion channel family protein [Alteromonas sp. ALT199]